MASMTPTDRNFTMFAGDSKAIVVTVLDDAGDPVDISSASFKWGLAKRQGDLPIRSKASGSGVSITNAAGGVFTVTLLPADTEGLAGDFWHEAEMTIAGAVSTVVAGRVSILDTSVKA